MTRLKRSIGSFSMIQIAIMESLNESLDSDSFYGFLSPATPKKIF